jgi:hypothetical protein
MTSRKLCINQIITEHGLTVSLEKTKLVALEGRQPVRSKIVIDKLQKNKLL